MSDRITELYRSAGVDTEGLEHKLREAWNKASYERRDKHLAAIEEPAGYHHKRWDQLPEYIRKAIRSIIKQRQQEKSSDHRKNQED